MIKYRIFEKHWYEEKSDSFGKIYLLQEETFSQTMESQWITIKSNIDLDLLKKDIEKNKRQRSQEWIAESKSKVIETFELEYDIFS